VSALVTPIRHNRPEIAQTKLILNIRAGAFKNKDSNPGGSHHIRWKLDTSGTGFRVSFDPSGTGEAQGQPAKIIHTAMTARSIHQERRPIHRE